MARFGRPVLDEPVRTVATSPINEWAKRWATSGNTPGWLSILTPSMRCTHPLRSVARVRIANQKLMVPAAIWPECRLTNQRPAATSVIQSPAASKPLQICLPDDRSEWTEIRFENAATIAECGWVVMSVEGGKAPDGSITCLNAIRTSLISSICRAGMTRTELPPVSSGKSSRRSMSEPHTEATRGKRRIQLHWQPSGPPSWRRLGQGSMSEVASMSSSRQVRSKTTPT
jgi:hypothetical protein